jgi:hypothetical protein
MNFGAAITSRDYGGGGKGKNGPAQPGLSPSFRSGWDGGLPA